MDKRDWHGRWVIADDMAERFWAKTEPAGGGCIEWVGGSRNRSGYGQFTVKGNSDFACRNQLAHRVAWYLHTGQPPAGHVLHSCDNPACVNPAHLRIGDQLANMQDCVSRGRHGGGARPGERHHQAKLTTDEVRQIRSLRGVRPQRAVAKQFGVSATTIGQIMRGEKWKIVQ
jgi:hypothetical protein